MRQQPLILAPSWDLHAAAVAWGLARSGIGCVWAPSLAQDVLGPVSIRADAEYEWSMKSKVTQGPLSAAWYRRPRQPEDFPRARECDVPCVRREWAEFHDNVYALNGALTDTLWVNAPPAASIAENKLFQLHIARQCRLRFPETLVSNDPAEIRRFIRKHGRVVYKSFAPYMWKSSASAAVHVLWVHPIDASTRLDDASLTLCPGIYQPCIEKAADLRVTIIGERIFAIQIRSTSGRPLVDWRQHAVTWREPGIRRHVHADAIALPTDMRNKLLLFMRRLGIVFGCIDLVVGRDGEVYFLEINQSGEFLFVEEMVPSFPVLRAMCSMLASGRLDYSLTSVASFSYPEYRRSEAFERWRHSVRAESPTDSRPERMILE
jgi:glutathione synthase/RimK-type ligase-like ATP-grasp enzyme